MTTTTEPVSQETPPLGEAEARFLDVWRDGVQIAGPSLFGCQVAHPRDATHWRQLTPKLDVMRRELPNRGQVDSVFAAARASFFNPEEGHKLMTRAGCQGFGGLAVLLDARRRSLLACLLANFRGW